MIENPSPEHTMNSLDTLFFDPWVGNRYSAGFKGRRVLLLGESHYLDPDSQGYSEHGFTSAVVQRWAMTGPTAPYFTKVSRLLLGGSIPSIGERTAFWESVVFYNYVQAWVGSGPRQRPTPANWATGEAGLRVVMNAFAPEVIVVLGSDLWWHVANALPHKPGSIAGTFISGPTTIAVVNHPSSSFTYAKWKPIVEAAFSLAAMRGIGSQEPSS